VTGIALARTVGSLVALKAVELAFLRGAPWWVAAALGLSGLSTFRFPRSGSAAIAILTFALLIGGFYSNHMTLVMWIAITLAVFADDRQQRFVLRCQLTILYAFAAIAKLWPDWLSGGVISTTWVGPLLPDPLLQAAAWLTLLVEVLLAFGVWSPRRMWLWLALTTHLAIVVASIQTLRGSLIQLFIFNGLAVAVWLRAHRAVSEHLVSTRPSGETDGGSESAGSALQG
jgi:hypothetical protein